MRPLSFQDLQKTLIWVGVVFFGLMSAPRASLARTWYVYADGSGDAPFIQAAVDSAQNGDVILVGPGSYPEPYVLIESKSLELASTDGAEVTQIRQLGFFEPPGTGFHSMTARGVTIEGGEFAGGGFTAYNVRGAVLEGCVVRGFTYHSMVRHVRDVAISKCLFVDNEASSSDNYGGGALFVMSALGSPPIYITDCTFIRNRCPHGSPGHGWEGGGALAIGTAINTAVVVSGCVFDGNEAPTAGAVFASDCVAFYHNTFINNRSQDGALYLTSDNCDVSGNLFVGNERRGYWASANTNCRCNAYWNNMYGGFYCSEDFRDIDPMLCDPEHGDYHLAEGSPLVGPFNDGEHDACEGPIGAFGVGCQATPVISTSWGAIKAKYGVVTVK